MNEFSIGEFTVYSKEERQNYWSFFFFVPFKYKNNEMLTFILKLVFHMNISLSQLSWVFCCPEVWNFVSASENQTN